MGQILSVAAFLYPVYGKKIDLTPVMDANALDGGAFVPGQSPDWRAGIDGASDLDG